MLYKIKTLPDSVPHPLKVTGTGFQFKFNSNNLSYFEDGYLLPNQDVVLIPFFPSTSEQAVLLKEYTDWCIEFNQPQNETLVNILSSVDYWKQVKHDELDVASTKFEDNLNKQLYFTSSLGFRCNGDRRTATNIAGLITAYDLPPNSGALVTYRDYDNGTHQLNKEQLQTLYLEHLDNGNMLYQQKWAMEAQIDAAETLDDLKALDLTFKMQDFSQPALSVQKSPTTLKSLLNLV